MSAQEKRQPTALERVTDVPDPRGRVGKGYDTLVDGARRFTSRNT